MFGTTFICAFVLFHISFLTTYPGVSSGEICRLTVSETNNKISNCFVRYNVPGLQYAMPYFDKQQILHNLCRLRSSVLKCMTKVIRPCSTSITHMLYNVDNFERVIDGLCVDQRYTLLAYNDCSGQIKSTSLICFQNLKSKTRTIFSEKGQDLHEDLCRLYLEMADCLSLEVTESCTNNQSHFLNTIFVSLYTYPTCSELSVVNRLDGNYSETYMYEHLSNLTSEPIREQSDKTTGVMASWTMNGFTGGELSSLETPRTPIERSCSSRTTDLVTTATLSITIGLLLS